MIAPKATIIVSPRERFQFARASLDSLYENTNLPFNLVYIDNKSPTRLREFLNEQAQVRNFRILRSNHYVSPNQARNLGLQQVHTPFVVFVDNDVIFSPGWLEKLVNCAEETNATVVGSLVCQYRPVHEIVHCAGGTYMTSEEYEAFSRGELNASVAQDRIGRWRIEEKTPFQNQPIEAVRDRLFRQETGFVEFHSMLVWSSIFDRIGLLDEEFSCTKEYLDFCMTVTRSGGTIYVEPESIVTFLTHPPAPRLELTDLHYFMLRWSDAWELNNLMYFQKKWGLEENNYFLKRYKKLGQRRRKELIKPISGQFSFLGRPANKWIESQLFRLEKRLNRAISNRHSKTVPVPINMSHSAAMEGS